MSYQHMQTSKKLIHSNITVTVVAASNTPRGPGEDGCQDYKNILCPINFMFWLNNPLTTDAEYTNIFGLFFICMEKVSCCVEKKTA